MRLTIPLRYWACLVGLLCLVACGKNPPAASPFPTLTVISPSQTPIPPTPSPTVLPTAENALDSIPAQALPPIPASLPEDAQRLIHAILDDAPDDMQVLGIKAVNWLNFECAALSSEVISAVEYAPEGVAGYRVIVGNMREALVYIGNREGAFLPCPSLHRLDPYGEALYIDPLALELVELAKNDLGRRAGADLRDIRPVDVVAVTWRDTSLGCPQADQIYPAQMIAGYRILLKYKLDYYAYHADFLAPVFCPLEREQMPPPFQATPTPFPTAIPTSSG